MGIIKFLFTFFFFYILIKVVRSVFFVSSTIKQAKKQQYTQKQDQQGDIIDAEYKVLKDD